jgi:hypothetical protein
MLHAFFIVPFIFRTIMPGFYSIPVLEIVLPASFVLGSVDMGVDPLSGGLIILPVPFIDVTICMPESPFPVGFVIFP